MPRTAAKPTKVRVDELEIKRKAAALKSGERRAAKAKAKAEGIEYIPELTGTQYGHEIHRLQAERHYTELHKAVVQRPDVVDVKGVWARTSPRAQKGLANYVLQQMVKVKPMLTDVMDMETFQLRPGVLHHGGFMSFDMDRLEHYGEEDLNKVKIFKSFDELEEMILGRLKTLIEMAHADPENKLTKATGKCWAHAGARFDWVGFALHLGADKNTKITSTLTVNKKKHAITWDIKSFSNKPRITLRTGRGGGYKYEMVDSFWLMPSTLKDLSAAVLKGELPEQFKDPISWMNKRGHQVGLAELRPYLVDAHLGDLESFRNRLSPEAYEALSDWKGTIDDVRYTQSDVVVLANALITYTQAFKEIMEPLKDFLGEEVMESMHPLSYNTASTAGFSLSMAYWYMSQYQRNQDGTYQIKGTLAHHFKETKIAECVAGRRPEMLDKSRVEELLESKTPLSLHGLLLGNKDVEYIVNPVFTTRLDNQFALWSQFGGVTENYAARNKPGHRIWGFDLNSHYARMAMSGFRLRIKELGGKLLNSALGFYHHSFLQSFPTSVMLDSGLATREKVINSKGEEVLALVVRGRQKILKLLDFRGGTFTVQLSPSTSDFLNECPIIPFRMEGQGLDSRMIRPRIVENTLAIVTGGLLGLYCSFPVQNDDDMVVYLCERGVDDLGQNIWIDRSRHAPILGIKAVVNEDRDGNKYVKIDGTPENPHAEFNAKTYKLREKYRIEAAIARERGDLELAALLDARSLMIKMILTGGGYGSYAQSNRPDLDINLCDLDEVNATLQILQALDPEWSGVDEFARKAQAYIPASHAEDFQIEEGATLGWSHLYRRLGFCAQLHEELEERISKCTDFQEREELDHTLNVLKQKHSRVPDELFRSWAAAQITRYSSYSHYLPKKFGQGQQVEERHGVLGLAESTADQAQRPFATQITDKGQAALFQLLYACWQNKYHLLTADTDGVKVGIPYLNDQGVKIEEADIIKQLEATDLVKFGTGLGELKFEHATVREGLGIADNGKKFEAMNGFFLGTKVYFLCDDEFNLKSCAVRSVPRKNAVHQAVMMGYSVGASSLGSKPGIQAESFRHVNLLENKDIEFAEATSNRKRKTEALFSNPRRQYPDQYSSKPFDAKYPASVSARIAAGELISPSAVSSAVNREMSLKKDMQEVRGLELALREYKNKVKISGGDFYFHADKVKEEIDGVQRALRANNGIEDFVYDVKEFNPFHDEVA